MLHLLDLRGLPVRTAVFLAAQRRGRVPVAVQKDATEMRAAPAQRIDRLPARPRGRSAGPPLLRPAATFSLSFSFVEILGSESMEGRAEWAGRAHEHWADEPSQWRDAPLWALVDVLGCDGGHVLRVLAVHAASESSAFPRSCFV